MGFLSSNIVWILIIIAVLAALILLIFFLSRMEKNLGKKLALIRRDRNGEYIEKLKKLNKSGLNPEKALDSISIIAKEFFNEAFNMPRNAEYFDLIEKFKKMEEKDCETFCILINDLSYSGKKIEKKEINSLLGMLEEIINKNKIISKEEKNQAISIIPRVKKQGKIKSSSKWKNRIKEIGSYMEEINRILYRFSKNPKMIEITKYDLDSWEYYDYIRENKKDFNKINSSLANLKQIHKKFKIIFGELYKESNNEQRIELKKFADNWSSEQSKVSKGITNPFKNQIIASKVLEKYITKLRDIILARFP